VALLIWQPRIGGVEECRRDTQYLRRPRKPGPAVLPRMLAGENARRYILGPSIRWGAIVVLFSATVSEVKGLNSVAPKEAGNIILRGLKSR